MINEMCCTRNRIHRDLYLFGKVRASAEGSSAQPRNGSRYDPGENGSSLNQGVSFQRIFHLRIHAIFMLHIHSRSNRKVQECRGAAREGVVRYPKRKATTIKGGRDSGEFTDVALCWIASL